MESKKKWNSILFIFFLALASFASGKTPDLYSRGRALYLEGQYQKALPLYQKALKADKKNWVILQAIGDTYLNLGQREEALRYYQLSLSAHPDNPTLEYFIAHPASNPAPPLSTPTPPYPSLKTLEFSISAGKLLPIQTESNVQNWNIGWQESFYLGAQLSDRWALGLLVDVMEPSNIPFPYLPPSVYPSFKKQVYAGNIALAAKIYPFSSNADLPLYLAGGGGIYLEHISGGPTTIYDPDQAIFDTPEINEIAPSLQWGLGLPISFGAYSKLLLEYRMVYVFTVEPIFYGGINVGGLIFF